MAGHPPRPPRPSGSGPQKTVRPGLAAGRHPESPKMWKTMMTPHSQRGRLRPRLPARPGQAPPPSRSLLRSLQVPSTSVQGLDRIWQLEVDVPLGHRHCSLAWCASRADDPDISQGWGDVRTLRSCDLACLGVPRMRPCRLSLLLWRTCMLTPQPTRSGGERG